MQYRTYSNLLINKLRRTFEENNAPRSYMESILNLGKEIHNTKYLSKELRTDVYKKLEELYDYTQKQYAMEINEIITMGTALTFINPNLDQLIEDSHKKTRKTWKSDFTVWHLDL